MTISKSLCPVYSGFSLRTALSCRLDIYPHSISQTRFIHYSFFSLNILLLFCFLLYLLSQPSVNGLSQRSGSFSNFLAHQSSQHLNKQQVLLHTSVCYTFLSPPHTNSTAGNHVIFSYQAGSRVMSSEN